MTIQVHQLPDSIVGTDDTPQRLANALRRAIDGELGKEGKRGSRGDGMRAVHNLATLAPSVYLPTFVPTLLPSLLNHLVAPSLLVRTLAAHALAGVAHGLAQIPSGPVHDQARQIAHDALIIPGPPSPAKSREAAPKENRILAAIRTTLNAEAPEQAAQGPAWALSVIASLLLCLDRAVCQDGTSISISPEMRLSRLMSFGMRHKKSTIRALVGVSWRVLVHLVFKRPELRMWEQDGCWDLLKDYVDSSVGVSMVAAVMHACEMEEEVQMTKTLDIVRCLTRRGEYGCADAVGILKRLLDLPAPTPAVSDDGQTAAKPREPFSLGSLLAPSLFSGLSGLFSMPFDSLHELVNEMLETQVPAYIDIPPLRPSGIKLLCEDNTWNSVMEIWIKCVNGWMDKGAKGKKETMKDFMVVWKALLKVRANYLLEKEEELEELAIYATAVISSLATLPNLSSATKVSFLRGCWTKLLASLPIACLPTPASNLLTLLISRSDEFEPEVKHLWGGWCAEVIAVCADPAECVTELFSPGGVLAEEERAPVWRAFSNRYLSVRAPWEGSLVLLDIIPPSSFEKDDFELWEKLLTHTLSLSADTGYDVLDNICAHLAPNPRIVDMILSSSSTSPPGLHLAELIDKTMRACYPPSEDGQAQECRWMARSLVRFFLEECELELVLKMLEGASMWVGDERKYWSTEDWEFDILPVYQHVLLRLAELPKTEDTLAQVSEFVLAGFVSHPCSAVIEAFQAFWAGYNGEFCTKEIERCLWAAEHDGALPAEEKEEVDEILPPSSPIPSSPTLASQADEWSIPDDLTLDEENEQRPETPKTPEKSTCELPFLFSTPHTPLVPCRSPTTPKRDGPFALASSTPAPATPKREYTTSPVTPKMSRKEKENVSPFMRTPRVLFGQYPTTPTVKRKLDVDADERKSPLKKVKLADIIEEKEEEKEDSENEREEAHVHQLVVPDKKRRPTMFMESVELPKLIDPVQPRRNPGRACRSLPKMTPVQKLRKTKSAPLPDVDIPASDDSIIIARERRGRRSTSKAASVGPSSDDNPRLGQVTPHHLISPAPRRRRRSLLSMDTDGDDDDSEEEQGPPSSPTRQAVMRKRQRSF